METVRKANTTVSRKPTVTETKQKEKAAPQKRGKVDFWLLLAVCVLIGIGFFMVISTTFYYNEIRGLDPFSMVASQLRGFFIGLIAMVWLATRKDYMWIEKFAWIIYGASLLSLLLVFFVGAEVTNGATRWIDLKIFQFQPSEVAKFAVVIALARIIHKYPRNSKSSILLLLVQLFVIVLPTGLTYIQPSMSMALIIAISGFSLVFVNDMKWPVVLVLVAAALIVVVVGIKDEGFRMSRFDNFTEMEIKEDGSNYQEMQARYALARGNLFGQGMSYSRQKYGFLPRAESDYVFAIIAEEGGLVGATAVMGLYVFVIWRGIKIVKNCRNRFGAYMSLGIIVPFALQTLVNMAVSSTAIPCTGQPLPFISFGGTSLLCYMAAFGVLLNVSKDLYR